MLGISCFVHALPTEAATLVGAFSGEAMVDNTGQANYTIPLTVPPGTAGMQPELAIAYSSSGKNGPLGIGFSLQGLSSITRAPATRIHDGLIDGINFNEFDRLLLDGQRLILISTNKAYGANGSEYRTEIDSFRNIILHGDMNSSNAWFEVKDKSGLIHEYGNTEDSFVEPSNTNAALTWAINRTQDRSGNTMDFIYDEVVTTGEHRIERIEYTGNATESLMPYNSVEFIYEDRPDPRFRYVYGARLNMLKRLSRIDFRVEGSVVHSYVTTYAANEVNWSYLESLQQVFANGDVIPPTRFNWSIFQGESVWQQDDRFIPTQTLDSGLHVRTLFFDMDGDGVNDMIDLQKFNIADLMAPEDGVSLSSPAGWSDTKVWEEGFCFEAFVTLGGGDPVTGTFDDLNGDGMIDFFYNKAPAGSYFVNGEYSFPDLDDPLYHYHGDPIGFTYLNDPERLGWVDYFGQPEGGQNDFPFLLPIRIDCQTHVGDLNGDGLVDLIRHGIFERPIAFTNSLNGWVLAPQFNPEFTGIDVGTSEFLRYIDLNGDGLTDVLYRDYTIQPAVGAYLNTGNGWQYSPEYIPPFFISDASTQTGLLKDPGVQFVDLNGDGLPDLLFSISDSRYGGVTNGAFLNTGRGWESASDPAYEAPIILNDGSIESFRAPQRTRAILTDVNGDGLVDIVYNWNDNGWSVAQSGAYLNTGSGWKWAPEYTPPEYTLGSDLVDVTGDGLPDLLFNTSYYYYTDGIKQGAYVNVAGKTGLLRQVLTGYRGTNEYSSSTEFFYKPLTDPDIYQKGSGSQYPVKDFIGTMYVVSELGKDNGYGNRYYTMYTYAHARTHQDRGFLGFQIFESYDPQTQLSQVETLAQDFPLTGMQLKTETFYIPDPDADPESPGYRELLKQVDNTWLYDKVDVGHTNLDYPLFYYLAKSTEKQWEIGNTNEPHSTVTTYNWFDTQDLSAGTPNLVQYTNSFPSQITYGELKKVVIDYGDGYGQIISNAYYSVNESDWLLGRLKDTAVTHVHSNGTQIVKTAHFDYIANTGLITVETAEDGTTSELRTDYAYDAFGNITNKVVSGYEVTPRSVQRSVYESKGRFVVESFNALDHKTTVVSDPITGQPKLHTDPNHLTTEWERDPLGRATLEERADGTQTTTTYAWESGPSFTMPSSPITNVVDYSVTVQSSGSSPIKVCYDRKGREVRTVTESADGRMVYKDTGYDAVGRTVVTSDPYFAGETPHYAFTIYDALSRPELITAFDGTKTAYGYGGLVNTVTNNFGATDGPAASRNQRTTTWRNAKGQTTKVEDTLGNQLLYEYDAAGNLTATEAGAGASGAVRTEMEYNLRGNKIRQNDPDMGEWHYTYNALGQLIVQTDANGNVTQTTYDLLGRPVARTNQINDAVNGLQIESVAKWHYDGDTEGDKLGKLRLEEHFDGSGNLINRKRYAYDQYSRPMLELMNYDDKWYYTCVAYDEFSRPASLHRYWRPKGKEGIASNLDPQWNTFVTTNLYNQRGVLLEVRDGDGHSWWSADASDYDQYGRVTQYQYGNGLMTTKDFNPLTGRVERMGVLAGQSLISDYQFGYDRIGNLTSRTHGALSETCQYDELNRLKVVAGGAGSTSTTYNNLGNITARSDIGAYLYNGPRPHAVTSAGGCTYIYDNNGNIISRERNSVAEFSIEWTSFNKPSKIVSDTDESEFAYSVDGRRTRQIIINGSSVVKKVYATPDYEMFEILTNPSETNRASWVWEMDFCRIYVDTPAGKIGIYRQEGFSNGVGTVTRSYLHKDHLGSVIATSDESGANVTFMSFDAWGNRRDPDDWSPITNNQSPITNEATDRGFTGHEHLDHVGLVHMNGRIYDPVIGRMISADPTIPRPFDLQSFNRYSYVNNGLLRYTDPSGFSLYEALQGTRYGGGGDRLSSTSISAQNLSKYFNVNADTTGMNMTFTTDRSERLVSRLKLKGGTGSSDRTGAKNEDSNTTGGHGVTASDVSVPQAPVVQNANNHSPLGILGRVAGGTLGALGNVITAPWNWLGRQSGYSVDSPIIYLKSGKESSSLPSSGRIGTEGIGGDYSVLFDKSMGYDAWIHNPSHGKLWDIVETGMQLIAGPGKWSKETSALLDAAARGGGVYDFIAHSQGGVQFGQALRLMTERFAAGSTVSFQNTPYNPFSAHAAGRHAGLSVDYDAHPLDVVPSLGNPWYIPTAGLYLPFYIGTGAEIHSKGVWQ